jgi:CheY-like chemotaxis protein
MSEPSAPRAATADRRSTRRPEEVKILVVDDEPDVATYLASVLEDAGMRVEVAHDGDEGLAAIRREPPDLISLDLVMPRKSGIRLLAELRRHREWSRIPVVVVTAHARDPEVRSGLDSVLAESTMTGPSLYLEKPVTPDSYLHGICQVLGVALPEVDAAVTPDDLRDQARTLIDSADEDTLRELLERLRKQQP